MRKDGMYQNAINRQDIEGVNDPKDTIFKYFCVPHCVKKHCHNYVYDFSKSYKDPIRTRPGECHNQDQDTLVKCSPINLESNQEICTTFKDECFKFNYETIDPKATYKFNQTIESYTFPLKKCKKPANNHDSFNYFQTSTISLFDKHIPQVKLFGA